MEVTKDGDPTDDTALLKAIRRRLLADIESSGGGHSPIVNNVYGGHIPSGGMMDRMGGAGGEGGGMSPEDFDYYVDITKKDLENSPETGKPIGWEKSVHRFRNPKKKVMGEGV